MKSDKEEMETVTLPYCELCGKDDLKEDYEKVFDKNGMLQIVCKRCYNSIQERD